MKQDWSARQDVAMNSHPMSQSTTPLSSPMSYSSVDDHAAWNTSVPMNGADYWPNQMEFPSIEQPQMMPQFQQDQSQMMPQFQQDQFQQDHLQQAWCPMAMQQPGMQHQQPIPQQQQLATEAASMQMQQMHMQVQPMQLQQMEALHVVESSPTELHRCMAIIMPETAQFPCDKNIVAAQLQAAADCQCYED